MWILLKAQRRLAAVCSAKRCRQLFGQGHYSTVNWNCQQPLGQLHHQRHVEKTVLDVRIDLAAHESHEPLADEKSQSVAVYAGGVAPSVEALKNLGQLLPLQLTAGI